MACKLLNVKKTAANCQDNFSGVGSRAYVALADSLVEGAVQWSDKFAGVAASSFNDGSKNATAEAAGAVQVYSDFAATVVADGKIAAALNDAIQPKFAVSSTGVLTASFKNTKRGLKAEYGMATNPYSADNNGDGVIKEWYGQSAVFSKYVVGKTGSEVASLEIKTLDNGYKISNDDALLNAGCTIQITSIMEVIAKAFTNAR